MSECHAERHGTISAYNHAHCRCPETVRLSARAQKRRRYRMATKGRIMVDPLPSRRRLQALARIGWDTQRVADVAGLSLSFLWKVRSDKFGIGPIHQESAQKISDAYHRLAVKPGPSKHAVAWALKQNWPSPLAWDDIDNPDARPYGTTTTPRVDLDRCDPAVIAQLVAGEQPEHSLQEVRAATIELWRRGTPVRQIARILGGHHRTVTRRIAAARRKEAA